MRTDRLESLSDGVFAVALTLLVLNLPFLKGSKDLGRDLLRQWPNYAAYVVSFVTVGIVWINHHVTMDAVVKLDRTVVELNLILLMFVAVMPWPTGLLAENLRGEGGNAAAVTYGVVMTLMATSFLCMQLRLTHAEDLCHPHFAAMMRAEPRRALIGPVAYATGAAVALVSAPIAFAIYASIAIYYATSRRRRGTPMPPTPGSSSPSGLDIGPSELVRNEVPSRVNQD